MFQNEHRFCRECGQELKERVGANRAILKECPNWPAGLHDSYFTGQYALPNFDPVTGKRNVRE